MTRTARPLSLAALGLLLAVIAMLLLATVGGATTATATGPTARAAKTCSPPAYPAGANGTFGKVTVTKTTCSTGRKVVTAFTKCRLKNGPSGRCVKKVLKYACREIRQNAPTQITATVTCGRGSRKVVHSYTQNL